MKSKAKPNLTTALTSDLPMLNEDKGMLLSSQDSQHSVSVGAMHAGQPFPTPVQPIALCNLIAAETSAGKSLIQSQLISMIEQYLAEVEHE